MEGPKNPKFLWGVSQKDSGRRFWKLLGRRGSAGEVGPPEKKTGGDTTNPTVRPLLGRKQ